MAFITKNEFIQRFIFYVRRKEGHQAPMIKKPMCLKLWQGILRKGTVYGECHCYHKATVRTETISLEVC